jgi:hypothetical protein
MKYLRTTITDTMSFWDNYIENFVFNPENSSTYTNYWLVPDEWIVDDSIKSDGREKLLEYMYGAMWRSGNDDGSRYQILKMEEHILDTAEIAQRPWVAAKSNCYSVAADGTVTGIEDKDM